MPRKWLSAPVRRACGFAALAVAALLLALGAWVHLSPALPLGENELPKPSLVLLTAQGEPFARRGEYREAPVDAARLPEHVVAPFVAIEDRRFYEHGGLDLRGILRAAAANLAAGGIEQGGSTITQQLAKIGFVGSDRSFARKLHEAVTAVRLEKRYDKNEILSAYLSRVYFGDGVYGLGAAARHYFEKEADALTVEEAAMLAGVVNAPSRLAPTRHLEGAQKRSRTVLAAMVEAGYLAEAHSIPSAQPRPTLKLLPGGGYFADWVSPHARASMGPGYGRLAVRTTLDGTLQQNAEAVVSNALAREGVKGRAGQGALIAMRTDGSVLAMVGGLDHGRSPFNRAVQAERQPGSAFKLFVYLAALRAGADGQSMVSDRPLKIEGWSPKNFGNRYAGQVSLTRAFADSSNVAAVRLSERVGRNAVIRAAQDLGVRGAMKPLPSVALGTSGTTLIDLTAAYAGVAAGAYPIVPSGLAGAEAFPSHQSSMPYEQREPLLIMLNAAVETGTGRAARLPIPSFGKTGTTQDHRDAWFVGFAGDLIVGVWVGNDDETPMKGVSGGGLPARIWRDFMSAALGEEIAAEAARQAERDAQEEEHRQWRERPRPWWDEPHDRPEPRFWLS